VPELETVGEITLLLLTEVKMPLRLRIGRKLKLPIPVKFPAMFRQR
jgi:hypothetical protein